MSLQNVQSALQKAFIDGAFFTADKTNFENTAFTPPSGVPWCALYFMPSDPVVGTLGLGGNDRFDGLLQIDLNYPANSGTKTVAAMVESLRNRFTAGARFAYSGQEVVIVSCGRSQGRIADGCYRVSVSVYFYAFVTR